MEDQTDGRTNLMEDKSDFSIKTKQNQGLRPPEGSITVFNTLFNKAVLLRSPFSLLLEKSVGPLQPHASGNV